MQVFVSDVCCLPSVFCTLPQLLLFEAMAKLALKKCMKTNFTKHMRLNKNVTQFTDDKVLLRGKKKIRANRLLFHAFAFINYSEFC